MVKPFTINENIHEKFYIKTFKFFITKFDVKFMMYIYFTTSKELFLAYIHHTLHQKNTLPFIF